MQKHNINAELAPQPVSAYSQAVEVSGSTRMLYISGQLGIDPDGTTPPDIAEQARLAWRGDSGGPAGRQARAEALGDHHRA